MKYFRDSLALLESELYKKKNTKPVDKSALRKRGLHRKRKTGVISRANRSSIEKSESVISDSKFEELFGEKANSSSKNSRRNSNGGSLISQGSYLSKDVQMTPGNNKNRKLFPTHQLAANLMIPKPKEKKYSFTTNFRERNENVGEGGMGDGEKLDKNVFSVLLNMNTKNFKRRGGTFEIEKAKLINPREGLNRQIVLQKVFEDESVILDQSTP